jgi:hypothetical protein
MFNIGWILDVKKQNKSEISTAFMLLVTTEKKAVLFIIIL